MNCHWPCSWSPTLAWQLSKLIYIKSSNNQLHTPVSERQRLREREREREREEREPVKCILSHRSELFCVGSYTYPCATSDLWLVLWGWSYCQATTSWPLALALDLFWGNRINSASSNWVNCQNSSCECVSALFALGLVKVPDHEGASSIGIASKTPII